MAGIQTWRQQHPHATLEEIEAAVDARVAELRMRMLQEAALASQAVDVNQPHGPDRPSCYHCGAPVESRGPRERQVMTDQGQILRLRRSSVVCPTCQVGFSPLDDELSLLPGQMTPRLHESVVRLGTWMPFAQVAAMLALFTGVVISEPTVRRATERDGSAYVAVQTAAVETIEQTWPPAQEGPAVQLLSVDGALVPLQHQEWAEVNTLALGTVGKPVCEGDEWGVHTRALSYCSRLNDAETFGHLALVETHRRGTETARTVCAVSDGAEWIQGFVNLHRPDALRILDVPYALGGAAQAGQAVYGKGRGRFTPWFAPQRQTLAYGSPEEVLGALRRLAAAAKRHRPVTATATIHASLRYVEKRRGKLDDAWYQARGDPIGRGSVESANTLVVERRLKGAGMHWARTHVNPLVPCARSPVATGGRRPGRRSSTTCSDTPGKAEYSARGADGPPILPLLMQLTGPSGAWRRRGPYAPRPSSLSRPTQPKAPYRPPPDHQWQRFRIGRARSGPPVAAGGATL
jgi:hypothetical protein